MVPDPRGFLIFCRRGTSIDLSRFMAILYYGKLTKTSDFLDPCIVGVWILPP